MVAPLPRFLAGRHSDIKIGTTTAIMPALKPCSVRPRNRGQKSGAVTIITTLMTNSSADRIIAFFRPKRSARPPPTIEEASAPIITAEAISPTWFSVMRMHLSK